MRIGVFDYRIIRTNPIGSCHLAMLRGLAAEHEFTVFAVQFDNPHPDKIRWVRVPAPTRPLALLFLAFHLLAPLYYLLYRLRGGRRFDLIQSVESNLSFGGVCYTHFCHRAYLKKHWRISGAAGLRGALRWLDHRLHAWMERLVYPRAGRIICPSRGLAGELLEEYPALRGKLTVVPNPIDLQRLARPADFDRQAFRRGLGLTGEDLVLLFVALGQFERKGLPLLLTALESAELYRMKLLVVGGERDLIERYRKDAARRGLQARVRFAGMQKDVRPYFWSADAFVFPSLYETFSLVTYEAAACGLPIVVSQLHGVEDLLRDGDNGFLTATSPEGVREALGRLARLTPAEAEGMGQRARASVAGCAEGDFVRAWRRIYDDIWNSWQNRGGDRVRNRIQDR